MSTFWGNVNGVVTVTLMIIFIGIWVWAWRPRLRAGFDKLASLPLEDRDGNDERVGQ